MKYYKKWAFRLFMLVVTFNIAAMLLTIEFDNLFYDPVRFGIIMSLINLLATICLIVGIFMVALIIKNKELNDSRSWIATIGLSLFFVVSLIIIVM